MKVFSSIKNKFIFFLIFLNINFILTQINDNFASGILEEGSYDLLDVTDYHNMNLVVSSSKKIYTGLPPVEKVVTNANLISVSALITINENYLLVACLEDSFLGKINLSTGNFVSLILYSDIDSDFAVPQAICTLSNIDNFIFIGHSQITGVSSDKKSVNNIYKITIQNKDSTDEGPSITNLDDIKNIDFGELDVDTSSLRQISCEPLNIIDNPTDYRLICLHEGIFTSYADDVLLSISSDIYAGVINSDFTDFVGNSKSFTVTSGDRALGFRIYKENSTYARVATGASLTEIYLDADQKIQITSFSTSSYNLSADIDLISYSNTFQFTFSAEKNSFMGKKDIYRFQINQKFYKNYFKVYNYQENVVKKILGYSSEDDNKIIFIYQTGTGIKYFTLDNIIDIYALESNSNLIEIGSYQETQYDCNNLLINPSLADFGYLNVEHIEYITQIDAEYTDYFYEYYGIEFKELLMSNNILNPEPSLNEWKTYFLSFIDHKENEYTKIYHLDSLTVVIHTCEQDCFSCWDGFDICTDCTSASYAGLADDPA